MKAFSKSEGTPVVERNTDQRLAEHDPSSRGAHPINGRNGGLSVQNARSNNRINIAIWLSAKEAATKLSCSTDTIERRAIPWQENAVRYKIRFKFLVLDEGGEPTRRYFEPDVESLLVAPNVLPMPSRRRLVPRFVRTGSAVT